MLHDEPPPPEHDEMIFPVRVVLPMGWGSAFWIVQRFQLEMLRRAGVEDSRVALASWPFPDIRDPATT